jgi:hypothetical protein
MKNIAKTIIDSTNGQLKISDQFIVSKNSTSDDLFGHYKSSDIEVWDVNNGFIHYTIMDVKLQEKYFFFSFCFFRDRFDSLRFGFKNQPGMLSWDDWSEAKEIQNKVEHDHWLNSEIGPGRIFQWGKIDAYYDPKGGGSGILLRYS